MTRGKIIFWKVLLSSLVAVCVAIAIGDVRQRSEMTRWDLLTASTAKQYERDLKPGTQRRQVESYLHRQQADFTELYLGDKQTDFVRLGRRPSGVWYCGPVLAGVTLDFKPSASHPPGLLKGLDDDTLIQIKPFDLPDDCL